MRIRDKNFNELKVGQIVHFGLRYDQWDGEVVELCNDKEKVVIKKKMDYGDGYTHETFNKIACSNYISIIEDVIIEDDFEIFMKWKESKLGGMIVTENYQLGLMQEYADFYHKEKLKSIKK